MYRRSNGAGTLLSGGNGKQIRIEETLSPRKGVSWSQSKGWLFTKTAIGYVCLISIIITFIWLKVLRLWRGRAGSGAVLLSRYSRQETLSAWHAHPSRGKGAIAADRPGKPPPLGRNGKDAVSVVRYHTSSCGIVFPGRFVRHVG